MRRGDGIISAMRPKTVMEPSRSFLVSAIIRMPMIVHHPGIESSLRRDDFQISIRVRLTARQVGRESAQFHQRSVGGGPSHTLLCIRDVHPALDREPVLAGAGQLIYFRLANRARTDRKSTRLNSSHLV